MLGKRRKLGKKVHELEVGSSYTASNVIEDRDLLMYLGLTDDANPLYIQHDYASQTPYKQPVVPAVMLFGMVSSIISMHLPGPGSHILQSHIHYPKPVHHYDEVKFTVEITDIQHEEHTVLCEATGFDTEGDVILQGTLTVAPPYEPRSMTASSLENFY
ncbi:MaoC/PaaZ C-terminal domain-containing protein [Thalassobacillus sp. CUG 92003]|uniref:MaoC/PaaZ C-terminal domain-containing protein n=1 Tax=Thalassobacillus sp. CUG 92003 TaxID=2736641 RepID=UPI0015E62F0D|nr:MaoC/PaaZ C-terminal domain-containing protein [Thalassobacillus sp. CUG 92003]